MFLVTDIANLALDAIGAEVVLGDVEDGTREAEVCLRSYRECLMQLLRAAHWQFARVQRPLLLLADATGQTINVGTQVIPPWIYEYAYPNDCVAARFVPFIPNNAAAPSGNISLPPTPLTTGLATNPLVGQRLRPSRFLISRDSNYPPAPGMITWEVQGVSPQGRTVVLSNIPNACLVYTSLVLYPSEWDSLFRAAMVAYLASAIALPLSKDRRMGMALRKDQIAIVKDKVMAARVADGNETWSTTDHVPDWIRARMSGSGYGYGNQWGSDGAEFLPYAAISFSDGSAF